MQRTPPLAFLALLLILGSGCQSRSDTRHADANGSMTISQGGDDLGGAVLGVVLYVTLQMIFNSGR